MPEPLPPDSSTPAVIDPLPAAIVALLRQPLNPALVCRRHGSKGQLLPYLEGHQAITQANRIFGFGGWSSAVLGPVQTRELRRLDPKSGETHTVDLYWATVRVQVHLGPTKTDVGCGCAEDATPESHDTAIKAAVTDGLKRALRQLGEQFGNGLYDRADPTRVAGARALEELRAATLSLGARFGLDAAATREHAARKAGRPFASLEAGDLARVLRAMAEALSRQRAA